MEAFGKWFRNQQKKKDKRFPTLRSCFQKVQWCGNGASNSSCKTATYNLVQQSFLLPTGRYQFLDGGIKTKSQRAIRQFSHCTGNHSFKQTTRALFARNRLKCCAKRTILLPAIVLKTNLGRFNGLHNGLGNHTGQTTKSHSH